MLVRLVGGPYHNRFIDTEFPTISGPIEPYYLVRYVSGYGTPYYQYVHRSLIRQGEVDKSTYRERLAQWKLPVRELSARLRLAFRTPSPAGLP